MTTTNTTETASKYQQYKRDSRKLAEILDGLIGRYEIKTIENVPGMAAGERLHINKTSGQIIVSVLGHESFAEIPYTPEPTT